MEKRGRQIVRANKLTRQRTLETNIAHLDRRMPLLTAFARREKENFLIYGALTETDKALLFFSELGSNITQKQIKLYFSSKNLVVI